MTLLVQNFWGKFFHESPFSAILRLKKSSDDHYPGGGGVVTKNNFFLSISREINKSIPVTD